MFLKLRDALAAAKSKARNQGGTLSQMTKDELRKLRKANNIIFFVIFGILLFIIVVGPIAVSLYFKDQTIIPALSGVLGITVGGGIEIMRRIWREWSQAGVILIENAEEVDVFKLVQQLLAKP